MIQTGLDKLRLSLDRANPNAGSSCISFRDVAFAYSPGGPFILQQFDLEIPRGSFFVLVGPSGCGKTTLLNLIAGYTKPSHGEVLIDGAPVAEPGSDRLVIFQGYDSLLGWLSVERNVEFGLKLAGVSKEERRARVCRALEMVNMADQGYKFPYELSGGMKQRVQLARALVCECSVLLMDEPFGSLDALTRSSLQDELTRLWGDTDLTVFFITHDIAEAIALGDYIGVMSSESTSGLKDVFVNDLPRPRHRADPAFGALYEAVGEVLSL